MKLVFLIVVGVVAFICALPISFVVIVIGTSKDQTINYLNAVKEYNEKNPID